MNRRSVIGLMSLSAGVYAKPRVRDRFIGVWRLVSCERKFTDGKVDYPYGEQPVGRITYDNAGRMSAQLMRSGRRSTVPPGVIFMANTSTEEIRESVGGFIAYFGKFEVDEASTTVIHHVQACLVPSWVGTDLKRRYRFYSNRLSLTAASTISSIDLVWEREPE
jgi:hypothetical protein